MPGGGYVTIQIELPENWDELVAPLGYEPLHSFNIDGNTNSQNSAQTPTMPSTGSMTVPAELADGTYRIVPSEKQITEAGHIYCADSGISYWSANATAAATMACPNTDFGKLLTCLGYNCSFTVKNGSVTEIVFRLSTVEKKTATDVSALNMEMIEGIKLSFSITTKQSKEAGGVTPGGTSLTLPSDITRLSLNLGGQSQLSQDSTTGFAQLDGNELVLRRDRDENKAAFLLDHLVFPNAVDAASPEHISAFDEFVSVSRYFYITKQFFYSHVHVRWHEVRLCQSCISVSLMKRGNDLSLLPKSRRVIDGLQSMPVCSVHCQVQILTVTKHGSCLPEGIQSGLLVGIQSGYFPDQMIIVCQDSPPSL